MAGRWQRLKKAAISIGLAAFDAKRAFPDGVTEAAALFSARADAQMLESLASDYDLANMKIRERIATCVMVRLRQNTQHPRGRPPRAWVLCPALERGRWPHRALCNGGCHVARRGRHQPPIIISTPSAPCLQVCSHSTVRVWLDDASDNLTETEAFLRRRIENVMEIEKAKGKIRDGIDKVEDWLPDFMKRGA